VRCQDAVRTFLSERGLERPNGRPLYWYRTTRVETEAFREALRIELEVSEEERPDVWQAAAFLVVGADWWRRNYDGTGWEWAPIFREVGLSPNLSVGRIYRHVAMGLKYWHQQVVLLGNSGERERRGWLATVACQGGLPTKVLQREGTRIREFLRRVLLDRRRFRSSDVSTRQLAFDQEHHLGESLRNEVFLELGVAVVEAVNKLLELGPDPADPVGDLDRRVRDWRQELPLDIEDDGALELLRLLVRDATEPRRGTQKSGIGVHTVLRGSEAGWSLERHLSVPGTAFGRAFSSMTGKAASDLPQRFEIYRVLPGGGKELVALVTRFGTATGDPLVTLETGRGSEIVVSGLEAFSPVVLELISSQKTIGSGSAPGGGTLLELPWIFSGKGQGGEHLELLGQGSVRTRDFQVHVAVPPEWQVLPEVNAEVVDCGELSIARRKVCRIQGRARILGEDGTTCIVATSSSEDDFIEYIPARSLRCDAEGSALYEGIPSIHRLNAEGDPIGDVPLVELEWRPAGSKAWRRDFGQAVGLCDVRHAQRGEVRFQRLFRVIPPGFRPTIEAGLDGRTGRVVLEGLNSAIAARAQSPAGGEAAISRSSQGWILEAQASDEPPTHVTAFIDFGQGRSLPLVLPFPVRTARFLGRDGRVLADGAVLSLDELGGVRAQVLAPGQVGDFVVRIELRCPNPDDYLTATPLDTDESLGEVFPGCHELDLSVPREKLALLLTTTTGLDTYFMLRIEATHGPQIRHRTLRICRYEREFLLDELKGRVFIAAEPEGADVRGGPETVSIRVKAIPLMKPVCPIEELRPAEDGGWQLDPVNHSSGPWILAGMVGDLCRVRPTLWLVPGTEGAALVLGEGDGCLASNSLIAGASKRRSRYGDLLAAMSVHPEESENWSLVVDTIEAFRSLPATSHDMFVGLSQRPEALPAVLFALRDEQRPRAWDYFEQLPVFWNLVPLRAWRDAADARIRRVQADLTDLLGMERAAVTQELDCVIRGLFAPLRNRLPAIDILEEVVRDRVRETIPGIPPVAESYLTRRRDFVEPVFAMWKQSVLGSIGIERLPSWTGIEKLQERLSAPPSTWTQLGVPDYSRALLNAPAVTAWIAAEGVAPSPEEIYRLRELRSHDPAGFDQAYTAHLCRAVPYLRARFPEVTV
jgi:hypothetical protein